MMACGRIQTASNNKSALLKQHTREVAAFLAEDPPQEEKARIRAEALMRDENLVASYEILQLNCKLVHERINHIQHTKTCPHDLIGVICTLIWAADRVNVTELPLIREQFSAKYGKIFKKNAMQNNGGCLNKHVVSKLSVEPPAASMVQAYLERLCDEFRVDWTPAVKLSPDPRMEPNMAAAHTGYYSEAVVDQRGTGLGSTTTALMPAYTGGEESVQSHHQYIPTAAPVTALPPWLFPTSLRGNGSVSTSATSSAPATVGGSFDLFDEIDIFVPQPSSRASPSSSKSDSGDENDNGASAPEGDDFEGDLSDSYTNLMIRFEQLKK